MHSSTFSRTSSSFQYQTGTIRRRLYKAIIRLPGTFQYQTGTIRSTIKENYNGLFERFQYQTGTIRRNDEDILNILTLARFNTKLVRLEVLEYK